MSSARQALLSSCLKIALPQITKRLKRYATYMHPKTRGIKKYIGTWKLIQAVHQNYCVITAPLQELLKKSVHFRWKNEQEDAFIKLKEALCKAPVLAYSDPDLPYVVDTDASNLHGHWCCTPTSTGPWRECNHLWF